MTSEFHTVATGSVKSVIVFATHTHVQVRTDFIHNI